MRLSRHILRLISTLLPAAASLLAPWTDAGALPLSAYTGQSVLASGSWTKISVETSGMHFIPAATLRSWGIPDPMKVRIHGYGGARISDVISPDTYIDDLPPVAVHATSDGVYFYGVGPVGWELTGATLRRVRNPFTDVGYYFISSSDSAATQSPVTVGTPGCDSAPAEDFLCPLLHEQELAPMGQMGHNFYGEDFRLKPEQTFRFELTDRVESTPVRVNASFAARATAPSTLSLTVGGSLLGNPLTIAPVAEYHAGSSVAFTGQLPADFAGSDLALTCRYGSSANAQAARLDFIEINYTRRIALDGGTLLFSTAQPEVSLDRTDEHTHVWDVTAPLDIARLQTARSGSRMEWTNTRPGRRQYAAWTEGAALPCPRRVAAVNNQNLHDPSADTPDMVIITADIWRSEAEKLARIRRNGPDPVNATVVTAGDIYNEFSSGSPDVIALRRYLKMVYDRGAAAGHPLRYALLLGRATHDNRGLTLSDAEHALTLPTWQTDEALIEENSYTSDDILAMLDDGAGANSRSDMLRIAVGRIPARSTTELRTYIDKLEAYQSASPEGVWRNRVMVVADNGDNGAHMEQTESFCERAAESGDPVFVDKVYIDAFNIAGGVCEEGRRRMYRMLDEGTMWWHYSGHGSQEYLTAEKVLTTADISSLSLRRLPVMCAVTCSFLRWDGSNPSGAERLAFLPDGGVIAAISATRRTFINDNAAVNDAIGRYAFTRDSEGRLPTVGEILQRAKNHITASMPASESRFRYVLLGDPSMRTVMPETRITVEAVNGVDLSADSQPILSGLQTATIRCAVTDASGQRIDSFNGTVEATLYDADRSTTTQGRHVSGTDGRQVTFDEHGDRLYTGRDTVIRGEFTLRIPMPADIADNFRPATLNMAAFNSGALRAASCFRGIYISGFDESADPDTIPPVIEYVRLNHSGFTDGSTVNPQPVLMARVTDNTAINLSTSGIGNIMTVTLDGNRTLTDISTYYTPETIAEGAAGTITYPLPELTDGAHTLELRVSDTSGNTSESTLSFYVSRDAGPEIFDIYTDTNPASTQARFYIVHDRPDATLTVEMEIYDLRGRRVWSGKTTGRSAGPGSEAITWDLRDSGGHRVERGIYIYRAIITDTAGHAARSVAKRLAVTAR